MPNDNRGGYWYTFRDKKGTTIEPIAGEDGGTFAMSEGGHGSQFAARYHGKIGTGAPLFGGMGMNFVDPKAPYDASKYAGISFWAKKGRELDRQGPPEGAGREHRSRGRLCTECFNDFGADLVLTTEWKLYIFPWKSMKQMPGWGAPAQAAHHAGKLYGIQYPGQRPSRQLRHLHRRPEVLLRVVDSVGHCAHSGEIAAYGAVSRLLRRHPTTQRNQRCASAISTTRAASTSSPRRRPRIRGSTTSGREKFFALDLAPGGRLLLLPRRAAAPAHALPLQQRAHRRRRPLLLHQRRRRLLDARASLPVKRGRSTRSSAATASATRASPASARACARRAAVLRPARAHGRGAPASRLEEHVGRRQEIVKLFSFVECCLWNALRRHDQLPAQLLSTGEVEVERRRQHASTTRPSTASAATTTRSTA